MFLQCVSTVIIVYNYKSTELISSYTLDIGLYINIIITCYSCGHTGHKRNDCKFCNSVCHKCSQKDMSLVCAIHLKMCIV